LRYFYRKIINMKRLIGFSIIAVLVCTIFQSCRGHVLHGEGAKVTKTVPLGAFTSIDVSVNSITTINVQPGAQPSMQVVAYQNHQEHIVTKIADNKLVIEDNLKPNWNFGRKKEIEFIITVPSLEGLEVNGATDASIHGPLTAKEFKLDISGAVNVKVDSMNVTDFNSEVSGAANIEVDGGVAQAAYYDISGAAKVRAFLLRTVDSKTEISGAAKAEINASGKLDVDISGAGKVAYKGHPVLTKNISGAGSITDAN
jgi:hypothetical protein